jgi:anthranilate synthase/aminodeoxychorismate synthase-like glutamine amidotransferase
MKVLLIDNYDSFVYNLKDALEELGARCVVVRNDAIDVDGVGALGPDAIVISPGPGMPSIRRDFGICGEVLQTISRKVPTLGVCLGHQGIAHFYGGKVVRAPSPVHGKTSLVYHSGEGTFSGLPDPFVVGRYHSFVVAPELPACLEVTARTEDGIVMGLRHREFPITGVQFHPESILTPLGKKVLMNFLKEAEA